MKVFRYSRVLIAIIAIGLIAALAIDFARSGVEQQNTRVDLAIDYEGLQELAQREGLPEAEVLQAAKDAGITSLAVYETTFKKLNENGKTTAVSGARLLESYHDGTLTDPAWRKLVEGGEIKGTEVYVTGHDKRTYREVKEDLYRRLGSDRVTVLSAGGEEVLAVKAHYESLMKMNLGMPTDEMQAVNDAGFYVLARPSNYEKCTPDDVKEVFSRLDGFQISEIVFSGNQVLGTPKALQTTIDEMKARGINLGLIEAVTQLQFYKQDGMTEIAKGLGYDKVARLYAIPKDEQPKLKIDTAVERWANTDMERNIRIDLLRIYDKPSPNMTLMETNMKYFRDTHEALLRHGFTVGPAATFEFLSEQIPARRAHARRRGGWRALSLARHPASERAPTLPVPHFRDLGTPRRRARAHGQRREDPRARGARERERVPRAGRDLAARPHPRAPADGKKPAGARRDGCYRALRDGGTLLCRRGVPLRCAR